MKNRLTLITLVFIFIGCNKNKPPEGNCLGVFSGEFTDSQGQIQEVNREYELEISETTKDSLVVNYYNKANVQTSTLYKSKKKIVGILKAFETSEPAPIQFSHKEIVLIGEWTKQKGEYVIAGDFESRYEESYESTQATLGYDVTGTFIIESKL